MSIWYIIITALAVTFGYYFRVWEHRHEMWHEQQVIDRIEALGCSAYVGRCAGTDMYGATDRDIYEQGATRLIALSKLLNTLEKKYG